MSDGHTPENSPSGEFYSRVKDKYQLWIWAIGLFIASVPLVAYLGKLPTDAQVKTAIAEAIAAHSSKMAHHGVSGMITRYAASKSDLADLRGDVIGQIEELSTLVGDLVDLSRDDAGGVVHEQVDISETVDRCLERVRRRRNDIEFDVHITPWLVYGDPAGLSRAVLNLLDNAAKWSPPGGRVSLRLAQVDATHAEMVVSDLGPGIPPEERQLVFERFYRTDSSRTSRRSLLWYRRSPLRSRVCESKSVAMLQVSRSICAESG